MQTFVSEIWSDWFNKEFQKMMELYPWEGGIVKIEDILRKYVGYLNNCINAVERGDPLTEAGIQNAVRNLSKAVKNYYSKPLLGLATTGELLDELKARAEVNGTINYKTEDL